MGQSLAGVSHIADIGSEEPVRRRQRCLRRGERPLAGVRNADVQISVVMLLPAAAFMPSSSFPLLAAKFFAQSWSSALLSPGGAGQSGSSVLLAPGGAGALRSAPE